MWKIIIVNELDDDFLDTLNVEAIREILDHFEGVIDVFSKLDRSVHCSNVIFPVETYTTTDEKLFIQYHIDSDDELIRVVKIDLE